MRILCLIKQVSEPESRFDLEQGQLVLHPPLRLKMNSYDEYALEAAQAIKDALPEAEVSALTVGPPPSDAVLQRAMGMGADHVVRLDHRDGAIARPMAVATAIAAWAGEQGFDLILAGVISEDAMQGAVGPMTAELMGLPLATSVVELALSPEGKSVAVQREMEGGLRQAVELPLPALVTINSGINRPRYPTLSKLLRAKQTPPKVMEPPPPAPSREVVAGVGLPGKTRAGLVLEGDTAAKAAKLLAMLRERALL